MKLIQNLHLFEIQIKLDIMFKLVCVHAYVWRSEREGKKKVIFKIQILYRYVTVKRRTNTQNTKYLCVHRCISSCVHEDIFVFYKNVSMYASKCENMRNSLYLYRRLCYCVNEYSWTGRPTCVYAYVCEREYQCVSACTNYWQVCINMYSSQSVSGKVYLYQFLHTCISICKYI